MDSNDLVTYDADFLIQREFNELLGSYKSLQGLCQCLDEALKKVTHFEVVANTRFDLLTAIVSFREKARFWAGTIDSEWWEEVRRETTEWEALAAYARGDKVLEEAERLRKEEECKSAPKPAA